MKIELNKSEVKELNMKEINKHMKLSGNVQIEYFTSCQYCDEVHVGGGYTDDSFWDATRRMEEHLLKEHNIIVEIPPRKDYTFEATKCNTWGKE